MSRQCAKCKKTKPISQFSFKIKNLGLRHYQCKKCTRGVIRRHYYNHKNYYLNKTKKRNAEYRLEMNQFITEYLSHHPCIDCKETDLRVLEFDHKRDKLVAVSSLIRRRRPLQIIKDEIEKCEVRCANCHRRKTAKDFKWLKGSNALVA